MEIKNIIAAILSLALLFSVTACTTQTSDVDTQWVEVFNEEKVLADDYTEEELIEDELLLDSEDDVNLGDLI